MTEHCTPSWGRGSLNDNDYYKFLMQARIFEIESEYTRCQKLLAIYLGERVDMRRIPKTVRYRLFNRDHTPLCVDFQDFLGGAENMFKGSQDAYYQAHYLSGTPGLSEEYVFWLANKARSGFNVNMKATSTKFNGVDVLDTLEFGGDWLECILFEVPLMALISELHFYGLGIPRVTKEMVKENAVDFRHNIGDAKFVEFGTRRRFSYNAHKLMNTQLKKMPNYLGTSNVLFSQINGQCPVGTIAHEWFLAQFAMLMKDPCPNIKEQIRYALMFANRRAWFEWIGYRGPEGKYGPIERPDLEENTAMLTDTFGSELFFTDMSSSLDSIRRFRHDSGDWMEFWKLFVRSHERVGESWEDKTIIFSDSLNGAKVRKISDFFKTNKFPINILFGVGTHLTNHFGYKPLNIVIKPVEFDGIPVLKISDDPGKVTGGDDTKDILEVAREMQSTSL